MKSAESIISVTVRVDSITICIDKYSNHLKVEGFAIDDSMNIFPIVLEENYKTNEIDKCHEAGKKYRVGSSHYVTGTFSFYTSPVTIWVSPSSVSLIDANLDNGRDFFKEHEEFRFAYKTWLFPISVSGKIVSVRHRYPDSSARLTFAELAVGDKIVELVLFPREIRRYKRLIKIDNFIDIHGRTGDGESPSDPDLLNGKIIVNRVAKYHQKSVS